MSISRDRSVETQGVAAKVAYPTIALVFVGAALCVLDKLGVIEIDDGVWLALLGAGGGVLGVGASAPAAKTRPKHRPR